MTRFLAEGLRQHDQVLIIATAEHSTAFLQNLKHEGINTDQALEKVQLECLDCAETLRSFMREGHPSDELFELTVAARVRRASSCATNGRLRVYGEMVGQLWKSGLFAAAMRLEQLWNRQMKLVPFSLFCGYPIDMWANDFGPSFVDGILRAHTSVLPSDQSAFQQNAIEHAMRDVLGPAAHHDFRKHLPKEWARLPQPMASIMWLRDEVPNRASEVLARALEYSR